MREKPFQGYNFFLICTPGLSLARQPWAGISQRLRRYGRLGWILANAFGVMEDWAGISQRLRRYGRLGWN